MNSNKLVGGSIKHPNKVMDVALSPLKAEEDQNIQCMSELVNKSNNIGFIYVRKNDFFFGKALSEISKLDLNQNLVLTACRGYNTKAEAAWDSAYNQGPTIAESLQNHSLCYYC
ncbi:MAG: hypothetical protein EP298_07940 [Gammaproteobacteria bacterium]|nr:MAG: hypothetical protein EP298_07940 [Gammaproteobacteria bacterium]UTW43636.1 hypothetical protein KFE69_05980 [bacterium SCSIO 12844]